MHIETYTTKPKEKAFEGKFCGITPNITADCIYNTDKETVVETRNVKFLDCPPCTQLPTRSGNMDWLTDENAT